MSRQQGRVPPIDTAIGIAPRFGVDANAVRVTKIYLDAARTNVTINLKGNWLWVQDASSISASADTQFNYDQGDKFTLRKGWFLRGVFFEQLIMSHAAQAGEWLSIMYGVEELGNLSVVNPTASAASFTETKATTAVRSANTVDTTSAIQAGADAARRRVRFQSVISNTGLIALGHTSSVSTLTGWQLSPGESVTFETSDDIWGIASVVAQTLVVWTESD